MSSQIFGVRGDEIILFDQPRPVRSVANTAGWSPRTILDQAVPAMKNDFFDLGASASVFPYDQRGVLRSASDTAGAWSKNAA